MARFPFEATCSMYTSLTCKQQMMILALCNFRLTVHDTVKLVNCNS